MATSLVSDIRSKVASVVAGDLTIRQFEDWFVPATWDVERSADQDAIRLAHQVLHQVSEYEGGLWNDDEFLRQLRDLLQQDPETGDSAQPSVEIGNTPAMFRAAAAPGAGQHTRLQLSRFAVPTINQESHAVSGTVDATSAGRRPLCQTKRSPRYGREPGSVRQPCARTPVLRRSGDPGQ